MRLFKIPFVIAVLATLAACAAFNVPAPETFNERAVAGYSTIATAAETASALLDAGSITAEEARDVHTRLSQAKEGIDIAVALRAGGDFSNAETRLAATIAALETLRVFLRSRQ